MSYQTLDIHYPEYDLKTVQIHFSDGENDYVLELYYKIDLEVSKIDPYTWNSDWDYYGFFDCEATLHDYGVYEYGKEEYNPFGYVVGKEVDDISLDDILSKHNLKRINEQVEKNYRAGRVWT